MVGVTLSFHPALLRGGLLVSGSILLGYGAIAPRLKPRFRGATGGVNQNDEACCIEGLAPGVQTASDVQTCGGSLLLVSDLQCCTNPIAIISTFFHLPRCINVFVSSRLLKKGLISRPVNE